MRIIAALLLTVTTAVVALPARAELYDVRLTNGAIFQGRYPPKQAAWDPTVLTFIDETGLEIALPKALVAEVRSSTESQGFGKVINTTTIDLGYAPNDMPTAQQQAAAAAAAANSNGFFNRSFDQQQFVEPNQAGGGIPVFGAGGGGALTPNPAAPAGGQPVGTPPPFTQQPTGGTPPPFTGTVPQTGTPAPFTTTPTGGTPPPFTTTPTTAPATGTSPGGTGH